MDIEIIWRAATCQLLGGRGRGGGREDRVRRSSFYGGTGAVGRGFRAADEEGRGEYHWTLAQSPTRRPGWEVEWGNSAVTSNSCVLAPASRRLRDIRTEYMPLGVRGGGREERRGEEKGMGKGAETTSKHPCVCSAGWLSFDPSAGTATCKWTGRPLGGHRNWGSRPLPFVTQRTMAGLEGIRCCSEYKHHAMIED